MTLNEEEDEPLLKSSLSVFSRRRRLRVGLSSWDFLVIFEAVFMGLMGEVESSSFIHIPRGRGSQ